MPEEALQEITAPSHLLPSHFGSFSPVEVKLEPHLVPANDATFATNQDKAVLRQQTRRTSVGGEVLPFRVKTELAQISQTKAELEQAREALKREKEANEALRALLAHEATIKEETQKKLEVAPNQIIEPTKEIVLEDPMAQQQLTTAYNAIASIIDTTSHIPTTTPEPIIEAPRPAPPELATATKETSMAHIEPAISSTVLAVETKPVTHILGPMVQEIIPSNKDTTPQEKGSDVIVNQQPSSDTHSPTQLETSSSLETTISDGVVQTVEKPTQATEREITPVVIETVEKILDQALKEMPAPIALRSPVLRFTHKTVSSNPSSTQNHA